MARRRDCRSTGRLRTYRTSGRERRLLQDLYGRISRWRSFSPFGKRRFKARYIVRSTETGNLVNNRIVGAVNASPSRIASRLPGQTGLCQTTALKETALRPGPRAPDGESV